MSANTVRVLVAMDKWKGTLTADQAHAAFEEGWKRCREILPRPMEFDYTPMSDGGEGFGPAVGGAMGGIPKRAHSTDAAGRPVDAEWWLVSDRSLAIFETAQANGLAMLPAGRFHPFECDTFGVGTVMKQIAETGVSRICLGIGGSATNDGGFGMARALGFTFLDARNHEISSWTGLDALEKIVPPEIHPTRGIELTVACDVTNPLLGDHGATRIYGPQKGIIKEDDFLHAERCLGRLSEIAARDLEVDHSESPGAGAAGGLGFGLATFCQAAFESGFSLFAGLTGLAEKIRDVDLVISGEGRADRSTLMGKGVGQILELSGGYGVPVLLVCGDADQSVIQSGAFLDCWVVSQEFGMDRAMADPSGTLASMVEKRLPSLILPHGASH